MSCSKNANWHDICDNPFMKKYTLIIAITTIFLSGCTKQYGTFVPINADLKAVFNYQPGTYWIYKDYLTGTIDSFFVTKNEQNNTSTGPHNPNEKVTTEHITIYISAINTAPFPVNTKIDSFTFGYEQSLFSMENGIVGYSITYPFPNNSIGNSTLIINNVSFTNVAHISRNGSIDREWIKLPPYTYNDELFLCPDVGMVKMIFRHPLDSINRIWELQRYKIVK